MILTIDRFQASKLSICKQRTQISTWIVIDLNTLDLLTRLLQV